MIMEITEQGFSYPEYSLHNIHDDDNCDDDNVNKIQMIEYGFSYTEYSLHNIHNDDNMTIVMMIM